jgi:hypothetical protein
MSRAVSAIDRGQPRNNRGWTPEKLETIIRILKIQGPYIGPKPSTAFELVIGECSRTLAKYTSHPIHVDSQGNHDPYAKESYMIVEEHTHEDLGVHCSRRDLVKRLFNLAWIKAHELVDEGVAEGVAESTREGLAKRYGLI